MGIFNRFLERLHQAPATDIAPSTPEVAVHDVMEQVAQYRQLMALQDDRQLLEILLPGQKNSFQSMIVGIDFVSGHFSLDEFSPLLAAPESLLQQTVVIRHHKHWEVLEFPAQITRWDPDNHCYLLTLPGMVSYHPRRHFERVALADNTLLKANIDPLYGQPWQATVKDISLGGMRVYVPGDLRPHLHRDKVLPKCHIVLDKNVGIICRGTIKAFSYAGRPQRQTQISIEFSGMSQQYQSNLQHFIDYIDIAA